MTTLAIIGGGIAGRSLIYTLAKKKNSYSEILLFDSDSFARTCSLRSTAIVAPRGVTAGHSELGDLLVEAYGVFSRHIHQDRPAGVFPITQYTGAITKLDQFKKRYPLGSEVNSAGGVMKFTENFYLAQEEGFLIDPDLYLSWLLNEAHGLPVTLKNEFVTYMEEQEQGILLRTQSQQEYRVQQVVLCGGAHNRYWQQKKSGKPIQGTYLEFSCDLGEESFSLTLEGDNLIYHAHSRKLLIGSTTQDFGHEMVPQSELHNIYQRLSARLAIKLPAFGDGKIQVGLREKASKRMPYLTQEGQIHSVGGFYKNGYSLALLYAQKLVQNLR